MFLIPKISLFLGVLVTFQSTWGQRPTSVDRISLRDHFQHPSFRRFNDADPLLREPSGTGGSLRLSSLNRPNRDSFGSNLIRPRDGRSSRTFSPSRRRSSRDRGSASFQSMDVPFDSLPSDPFLRRSGSRTPETRSDNRAFVSLGSRSRDDFNSANRRLSEREFGNLNVASSQRDFGRVHTNHRRLENFDTTSGMVDFSSLDRRSSSRRFSSPGSRFNDRRSRMSSMGITRSLPEQQTTRELIEDINLLLNLIGPDRVPGSQTVNLGNSGSQVKSQLSTSVTNPSSGMANSQARQSGFDHLSINEPSTNTLSSNTPNTPGPQQAAPNLSATRPTPEPTVNAVDALNQVLGTNIPKAIAARMVRDIMPSELLTNNSNNGNNGTTKTGVAQSGIGKLGNVRIVTEEPLEIDEIIMREMLKKMRGQKRARV